MNGVAIEVVNRGLWLFEAYKMTGFVFALIFVTLLIQRVDPAARGWAIGFRILIIPGVIVFWPLFAIRLLRGKRHPEEKNAHRTLAKQHPIETGGISG